MRRIPSDPFFPSGFHCFPHLLPMDWALFFCFGLFVSHFEPGHIFHLRISCFVQLAFLVCFQGYILGLSCFALDAGVLQCFGDFL